jgi:hypothetical protein
MRTLHNMVFGGVLLAVACGTAFADEPDHARWFVADATPRAQYQTMKKEAEAGYRETLSVCRGMSGSERNSCNKDARDNFRMDMTNARAVLAR